MHFSPIQSQTSLNSDLFINNYLARSLMKLAAARAVTDIFKKIYESILTKII